MRQAKQGGVILPIRIKEYCEKIGIRQAELAVRLGVEANTIYRWTSGTRVPHWNDILAMCEIFNCTADELMGGSSENPQIPRKVARKRVPRGSGGRQAQSVRL